MANMVTLTGKKYNYLTKDITQVTYIANYQTDGYCYFNDDFQYRCLPDGSNLQLFYYDKQIWIGTANITELAPQQFDILQLIFNLFSNGTVAPNADVETAVQWLIDTSKRDTSYDKTSHSARVLNSDRYNCSTAVITAFWYAGFGINSATYTGNMRSDFVNHGFIWIPGAVWKSSQLQRGDILLCEERHTQVYIGNNKDVNFGGSTGAIITHCERCPTETGGWVDWHGILRYPS